MTTLWVEKYRPTTLDDYVWKDPTQRTTVESWIASGSLPHLLLSGLPGTGKTSLAKLMLRVLGVPKADILEVNASRERKIDEVQARILNFVQTWPIGDMKYVLLDEADSLSPLSQRFLRGEMETYHDICRFILTCNYPEKIIPALHGRCQGFRFEQLDETDFITRAGQILVTEGVEFDVDDLMGYVKVTYPDLRKCINLLQQASASGKLPPLTSDEAASKDYMLEMVNLFKSGRFTEARKLIVGQAQVEEYPEVFRFLYRNLDLFGSTEDQQDRALVAIRDGLYKAALVHDAEINLSATLAELAGIAKGH